MNGAIPLGAATQTRKITANGTATFSASEPAS